MTRRKIADDLRNMMGVAPLVERAGFEVSVRKAGPQTFYLNLALHSFMVDLEDEYVVSVTHILTEERGKWVKKLSGVQLAQDPKIVAKWILSQLRHSRLASGRTLKDLHGQEFAPRRGLEGPFRYRSGVVLYYDPKEGEYYDPLSDMYVSDREFRMLTGEAPDGPNRAKFARTYKEYVEDKERKKEKPMPQKQWEARHKPKDDKGGKADKPKGKSKAKVVTKGEHDLVKSGGDHVVILSGMAKNHILGTHTKPGKGSVFNDKIKLDDIQAAIAKIPADFLEKGGGAYEVKVPNAGYDLVQKSSDILKKYPKAKKVTVEKEERGQVVKVTGYIVDNDISDFGTDTMSVVVRPTTPDTKKFLPKDLQDDSDVDEAVQGGKAMSMLSAWPGASEGIPQASQWGDDFAVIIPNGGKGAVWSSEGEGSGKKASFMRQAVRIANRIRTAKNLPADVERYVKEMKEKSPGKEDSYYWAVAWSRYCQYKDPSSDHCKQDSYFPGKKKTSSVEPVDMNRALMLLTGPGFGKPGMSVPEAMAHLVKGGMSKQDAYLAVKAGVQLARDQGVRVREASLRAGLIKLGKTNPELRKHLRPILAYSKVSETDYWNYAKRKLTSEIDYAVREVHAFGMVYHLNNQTEIRRPDKKTDLLRIEITDSSFRIYADIHNARGGLKHAVWSETRTVGKSKEQIQRLIAGVIKRVAAKYQKFYVKVLESYVAKNNPQGWNAQNSNPADTISFRGISLGRGNSVRRITQDWPGFWTVEPSNRQRLDHYVGQHYNPGPDDDEEGWDSDGWEEEYAGPMRETAEKWIEKNYGKGLFFVDVGEKGHLEIQLSPEGKKKYGVK